MRSQIKTLAIAAGQEILRFYKSPIKAVQKEDRSPVTEADFASNRLIVDGLRALTPEIPIISEESEVPPFEVRAEWREFWLVDPLDGTKEFLRGSDEFTVNIALIRDGEPVLGVIQVPATGEVYWAEKGLGTWKAAPGQADQRVYSNRAEVGRPLTMVESRSYRDSQDALQRPEFAKRVSGLEIGKRVPVSSSLKFCWLADGRADLYARIFPCMEWDVAAGDCLYRNSGREGPRQTSIRYNQPDLKVGPFLIGLG